jgi:hypothetical protein
MHRHEMQLLNIYLNIYIYRVPFFLKNRVLREQRWYGAGEGKGKSSTRPACAFYSRMRQWMLASEAAEPWVETAAAAAVWCRHSDNGVDRRPHAV